MTSVDCDLLVLGAGPGGYTAAFRAADLGLRVVLVERYPALGGVCLNVGCIPSKALLHAAGLIDAAAGFAGNGIRFGTPEIDLEALRSWKERVVARLSGGLSDLARQRQIQVLCGRGTFTSPRLLHVEGETPTDVAFAKAIIAVGSRPTRLPWLPDDPRILDSTGALRLTTIPARILIIGGGIIGAEMATIFAALGSRVTLVEMLDRLVSEADADLVRPLQRRLRERCEEILLGSKVEAAEAKPDAILVTLVDADGASRKAPFDAVLVAVGRQSNGASIGADAAGVSVEPDGMIRVDERLTTNVPHILAIGDVTGNPMLAHRAAHQGKVAAEVAAGEKVAFDAVAIPAVAYTDPEIAWVGLTEAQARERKVAVDKGVFPWSASGRALGQDRPEGLTKLLFDPGSKRLLGAGIVGPHAGDLIGEATLAIEMGADVFDVGLTVHPHPTLSETIGFAAEVVAGTVTDLYLKPRRRKEPQQKEASE